MLTDEQFMDVFKEVLPKINVKLLGQNVYDANSPKEIKIVPLTLAAEKRILSQDYQNDSYQMLLDIISASLIQKMDISYWYMFDVDYVFNQIRIITHGSTVNLKYTCPVCKATTDTSVDLSIVDINPVKSIEDITFESKDPNVVFVIPTVKKYREVIDLFNSDIFITNVKNAQSKLKVVSPEDIDKTLISDLGPLAAYVTKFLNQEITGTQDYVYLILFLLSLTRNKLSSLRTALDTRNKVFSLEKKFKCPKCGTVSTISISDLGVEYFFPSVK